MLTITRYQNESQTIGYWRVFKNGKQVFKCFGLELPWKNNQRNISCIPTGEYEIEKITHDKYGNCLLVKNVPGRSDVLVHFGNFISSKNPNTGTADSRGCPLPGENLVDLDGDGELDVSNSNNTMKKILSYLPQKSKLVIK